MGLCSVAATLLLALPATAVPTLADCAALDDDAKRLACYDEAQGRKPKPRPTAELPAAGKPIATEAAPMPATAQADAATTPPSTPSQAAKGVTAAAARSVTGQADNLATPPPTPRSLLGEAWALDANARDPRFNLRFHNPNYVIVRYSGDVNRDPYSPSLGPATTEPVDLQSTELKFQVSFKARLWETENRRFAMWLGYTQQSNWQSFNEPLSRPFRETDYMPELMMALRPDLELGGWRWRLLNLGVVHQSNGRADPLSRSWNRAYAEFGIEKDNFAFYVRPWYRFKESADDDNNPDITDYMGHGDIRAIYRSDKGYAIAATGRWNGQKRKGAFELELSTPPLLGPLKGYVQVFSGYGESLIDYNWRQTTIGAGLSLNDIL